MPARPIDPDRTGVDGGSPESEPQATFANDKQRAVQRQLAASETLDVMHLRLEWRRLLRSEPPPLSRDLILRALAYGLQERVYGGLSKAVERQLASLNRERGQNAEERVEAPPILRQGTRLMREWRGRTHTVLVAENGFEYAGASFTSLTTIARQITGARWSGPRFFGLRPKHGGGDGDVSAPTRRAASNSPEPSGGAA